MFLFSSWFQKKYTLQRQVWISHRTIHKSVPNNSDKRAPMGLKGILNFINTQLVGWGGSVEDNDTKQLPTSSVHGKAAVIDLMVGLHGCAHRNGYEQATTPESVFRDVILKILTIPTVQTANVVVFAADIQSCFTGLKDEVRRQRDAKRDGLGCYGTNDIAYFTGDGIVAPTGVENGEFNLPKLLRSRAHLGTFFQFLSDSVLEYITSIAKEQRTSWSIQSVVWDFHAEGFHVIDVVNGERVTIRRPVTTAVGEGEQMLSIWANILTRRMMTVTCLTSDTDFLPIALSMVCTQSAYRRQQSLFLLENAPCVDAKAPQEPPEATPPLYGNELGKLVWQRWPFHGPSTATKKPFVDVRALARKIEEKIGVDVFLLLCVLGGNDFIDKQAFFPRINMTTLITDKWPTWSADSLRQIASDLVRRTPHRVAATRIDQFVGLLGVGKEISRKRKAPPAISPADYRVDMGVRVMKVIAYWYLDWNAHGSLGWDVPRTRPQRNPASNSVKR